MRRRPEDLATAVGKIKTAILQSRYMAMRLANVEMLKLYLGIGGYVSINSCLLKEFRPSSMGEISEAVFSAFCAEVTK